MKIEKNRDETRKKCFVYLLKFYKNCKSSLYICLLKTNKEMHDYFEKNLTL